MKKLIFLLLMVALTSFGFANAAHPPSDAYNIEAAEETILAEYGVQEDSVTQPTVLVLAVPAAAEPSSIQAVMAYVESTIRARFSGTILICFLDTGQYHTGSVSGHYYLRC
jgi:small neutral amino acid transporter SnatA (MarC family)